MVAPPLAEPPVQSGETNPQRWLTMSNSSSHSSGSFLAAAASLSLAASASGCAVAYFSLAGELPPGLYGEPASRLAIFRYHAGIPIEFPMALYSLGLLLGSIGITRAGNEMRRHLLALLFASAIPFLALHIWLVVARPGALTLLTSAAAAGAFFAVSGLSEMSGTRDALRSVSTWLSERLGGRILIGMAVGGGLAVLLLGSSLTRHTQSLWGSATEAQARQFTRWFAAQPRGVDGQPDSVRLIEYIDYQCPPCRQAFAVQRPVLQELIEAANGHLVLEVRDYPLDSECNDSVTSTVHGGACEAAAAMLLARRSGREAELEGWLYDQNDLSRRVIEQRLETLGLGEAFEREYGALIREVRSGTRLASAAGVTSTPTFFLSGVRLPGAVSLTDLRAALELELRRVGVAPRTIARAVVEGSARGDR